MRNGQYSHQKVLLMKNPQFLSKYDETLPKCLQHELVKNAKFHQISTKIEDFSLIVLFGACIVRFASVSTQVRTYVRTRKNYDFLYEKNNKNNSHRRCQRPTHYDHYN